MAAILNHRTQTVQRQTWKWGRRPKLLNTDSQSCWPQRARQGVPMYSRNSLFVHCSDHRQQGEDVFWRGGLGAGRSWMGLNLGSARATQRASESEVRERRLHSTELVLSPPVAYTHTHTNTHTAVANGSLVTCSHRVSASDAPRHKLKWRSFRNKTISLKTQGSDRLKAHTVILAESVY